MSHPTATVDRLRPVGRLCSVKRNVFFVSLPLNHSKRLNGKEHRLLTWRLPVVVVVSLRCFDVCTLLERVPSSGSLQIIL